MLLNKTWITTLSIISVFTLAGIGVYAQESVLTENREKQNLLVDIKETTSGEMNPIPKNVTMLEQKIISNDSDNK
ncbi:hypothetical protein [Enterococcus faecalis]|uniref:hypothetical protein n=1 Tax=Enterococcus faecalis TaxID=1351 RepID=UPI0024301722|nr:hypothetical protein [Enterococcus faecalis]